MKKKTTAKKSRPTRSMKKTVSSSLLAVTLSTSLIGGTASALGAQPAEHSGPQPPVYQGDSLQYFTALIQTEDVDLQLTSGEDVVPAPVPSVGSGTNAGAVIGALIPAVNSSQETPNSASLDVVKSADGKQLAKFKVLKDGIEAAVKAAKKRDTIEIVVPSVKGSSRVEADIPSAAIQLLASKSVMLSIQTGDIGVRIPSSALPLDAAAKQLGVDAAKLELKLKIEKVASASAESYELTFTAGANGQEVSFTQMQGQFAAMIVPIAKPVAAPKKGAAYIIENGVRYPVPVTFDEEGRAHIHSTRTGTFVIEERNETFADTTGHWAAEALDVMGSKGVLESDETGKFNPDAQISRVEFARLIVRALGLEGSDTGHSENPFHDIDSNASYAAAVQIAVNAGLFKGIAEGTFAPDRMMTREQMAAVLVRAAAAFQLELPSVQGGATVDSFRDMDSVSDWAKDDMRKAIESGLLQGTGGGQIASQKAGTKSQSAVVIMKLLQQAGLMNS
ncbi:S-layer homology domain-containing protein [Paenibacillus soyae]|uniref:S-layer homology domain-containing protein n=1 Tax=Paenibacillus soyae TaxID=2969249 RepID=A0A9X2MRD7_9BACL|nr:S-layer homology domain-containing protein [Paenibacillus soyae]MCR2806893.1 S-layer homology domain-containing protein [Paenibacillus soyae]